MTDMHSIGTKLEWAQVKPEAGLNQARPGNTLDIPIIVDCPEGVVGVGIRVYFPGCVLSDPKFIRFEQGHPFQVMQCTNPAGNRLSIALRSLEGAFPTGANSVGTISFKTDRAWPGATLLPVQTVVLSPERNGSPQGEPPDARNEALSFNPDREALDETPDDPEEEEERAEAGTLGSEEGGESALHGDYVLVDAFLVLGRKDLPKELRDEPTEAAGEGPAETRSARPCDPFPPLDITRNN